MKEAIINGVSKQLTSEKDQIKYVIALGLQKLGWKPVYNEISGVYVKNGFNLFVYSTGASRAYVANKGTLAGALSFYNVPRSSWHLEKAGTLIDSGRLKLDMSYVYDTDYFEDSDYQAFLHLVDSYTQMSSFELKNHQSIYTADTEETAVPVASDKQVLETMLFKVISSVDQLESEGIYQIMEVDNDDKMIYVVNIYNSQDVQGLTFTEFATGVKLENFIAIELKKQVVTSDSYSLKRLTATKTSSIPEPLNHLGFTDEQLNVISKAIAERVNILPLLRTELDPDAMEEIITLCKVSTEINQLIQVPSDIHSIKLLIEAAKQGFSLFSFLDNYNNSEELQLQLQDAINSYEELLIELRADYNIDAIETQKFVSSSYFKAFLLNPDYNRYHVKIRWLQEQYILRTLCGELLNNGMTIDKMLYMTFTNISKESRAELRSYFYDKDLKIDNEDFSVLYDKLLLKVNYVAFNHNYDFLLSTPEGFIAHLEKSFILLSNSLEPKFYFLKLNGEFIEYGDDEFKNNFFNHN